MNNATLAPMPSAITSTATRPNLGVRTRPRIAYFTSLTISSNDGNPRQIAHRLANLLDTTQFNQGPPARLLPPHSFAQMAVHMHLDDAFQFFSKIAIRIPTRNPCSQRLPQPT